jgi:hypothetical protein
MLYLAVKKDVLEIGAVNKEILKEVDLTERYGESVPS